MSEYQYYEFRAVDRPLTEEEMRELRAVSSRAEITPSRFVNFYTWGDFKGNPATWVEKYFDAFLYLANWGTHELMLRLPCRLLDPKTAKRYCRGDSALARASGEFTVLEFRSENEYADDVDDGSGWLSSLIALRAELASGDHRALYLAWLLCVQNEEVDEDEPEPPVPPGLGKLTAGQRAFSDFLRIDGDLVAAAAERSPPAVEAHRREEAERAPTERARREQAETEAREWRLDELAGHQKQAWRRVDELIAERKPASYDEAVELLRDLRALGSREGRAAEVDARIDGLRRQHARKSTLLERLERAGISASGR